MPKQSYLARTCKAIEGWLASRRAQTPETHHQMYERITARWTRASGLSTVALAVISLVTAVIFLYQLNEMRAERIAEQRPWVSLDVKPSGPLKYAISADKSVAHWTLELSYQLENHGKTPATNVVFWGHLIPLILRHQTANGIVGWDWLQETNATCGFPEAVNALGIEMGKMIFPNERVDASFELVGDPKTFAVARQDAKHYSGQFMVIVCASYRNTLDSEFKRTSRIFYIGKKSGPSINLNGETIDLKDLYMAEEGIHGNHVD